MRLSCFASLGLVALSACAPVGPTPPGAPVVELAPPVAPPPPAPPSLLVIPGAEASRGSEPEPPAPEIAPLRSEGRRHALERIAEGVTLISEERGVIGFLRSPVSGRPIRWAGFTGDDAVLVAADGALFRAASPEEALAGKLDRIGALDERASVMDAGGQVVVAAAPEAGGPFLVSTDGGRTFGSAPRPGQGRILGLVVRGDGMVVAAIEAKGGAEIHAGRAGKGWARGPLASTEQGSVFFRSGDSVIINPASPKRREGEHLGLDARGRWIHATMPSTWLSFPWTSTKVEVSIPIARPGFPSASGKDESMMGGLLGMLAGGDESCHGPACLAGRPVRSGRPAVRVFDDAVCARDRVRSEKEKVYSRNAKGQMVTEEVPFAACAGDAPPVRGATLLLPGEGGPRVAKLPVSCAEGLVVGTSRASFVRCSSEHQGRAGLFAIASTGALAEVAPGIPDALTVSDAESASDGTTLLYGHEATLLCVRSPASCAAIPLAGYLAARPLPGGRALVARSGARPDELALEVLNAPGSAAVTVRTSENVIDLEVTAEGHVRLWQSTSLHRMESVEALGRQKRDPEVRAFRVREDGGLVPDPEATEALLSAVAAERGKAKR